MVQALTKYVGNCRLIELVLAGKRARHSKFTARGFPNKPPWEKSAEGRGEAAGYILIFTINIALPEGKARHSRPRLLAEKGQGKEGG